MVRTTRIIYFLIFVLLLSPVVLAGDGDYTYLFPSTINFGEKIELIHFFNGIEPNEGEITVKEIIPSRFKLQDWALVGSNKDHAKYTNNREEHTWTFKPLFKSVKLIIKLDPINSDATLPLNSEITLPSGETKYNKFEISTTCQCSQDLTENCADGKIITRYLCMDCVLIETDESCDKEVMIEPEVKDDHQDTVKPAPVEDDNNFVTQLNIAAGILLVAFVGDWWKKK